VSPAASAVIGPDFSGTKSTVTVFLLYRRVKGAQMASRNFAYYGSRDWAFHPGQETMRSFAAAFFTATLVTDWAYTQTLILMWKDFSAWLLFAGLIVAGVGVVLWLIGLMVHRTRPVWTVVLLNALVLGVAVINSLVHAGDGWTAIVPWGIGLSLVTCLLMLLSAALRRMALHPERRA
jgi:uncharacterized membrane protein